MAETPRVRRDEECVARGEGSVQTEVLLKGRSRNKGEPPDPDRYGVFIRIAPGARIRAPFFFLYGLISTFIIVLFGLVDEFDSSHRLALSAFFLLLPIYGAVDGIRYLRFRGWRKRLPFTLSGWEQLAGIRKFDRIFWRDNCAIRVIMIDADAAQERAVDDALAGFAERANKKIYPADSDRLPQSARRKKFVSGNLKARGSANTVIIGLIMHLCRGDLSGIAKQSGRLTSVTLSIDPEVYAVMPCTPTGPDAS
jgi:hypothetical protein